VRLGREVEDEAAAVHRLRDRAGVADVAVDEAEAGIRFEIRQVLAPPGVGQLVQHDHAPRWALTAQQAHKIRPDKTGAAGDKYLLAHGSAV
jgi:hypothetical protein